MPRRLLPLLLALLLTGCALPRVIVLNDPLDARQHNDLGVAYERRGETDLALREYDRAAAQAKEWARPLINRGNVEAGLGRWREAQKSYRQALRREPLHAEAMNNLAWALLQTQEPEEAREWARKAVAAAPGEPAFLDTLAGIELARGDVAAAREAVERGLELAPAGEILRALEEKRDRIEAQERP
jgi:tetratricopeptide (TPR) repeat protein